MEIVAYFTLDKETKGAVRYRQTTPEGQQLTGREDESLTNLYIRKTALASPYPKTLVVTVKEMA
jgi:hypothetical protein